jgi:hypothetical protein
MKKHRRLPPDYPALQVPLPVLPLQREDYDSQSTPHAGLPRAGPHQEYGRSQYSLLDVLKVFQIPVLYFYGQHFRYDSQNRFLLQAHHAKAIPFPPQHVPGDSSDRHWRQLSYIRY